MTEPANHPDFDRLKCALQAFQSARLNDTYTDLKSDPEYAKIGHFFFERLYAPEDFSFRNASIKKLHQLLKGKVYKGMIKAVTQVIELHELSDMLDDRMVEQMMESGIDENMDMNQYQEVYRSLDNYDQRIYQIKLSTKTARAFHKLSKKWVVALSLKTVRMAANLMGIGKIIDFVYEGYDGFRAIKNIDFFVDTVEKRETAWHNEIWYGKVKTRA
jgi:hypothetical protein